MLREAKHLITFSHLNLYQSFTEKKLSKYLFDLFNLK